MQISSQGSLGGYLLSEDAMAERYGGVPRQDLENSDFVFPETRTFPIMVHGDVRDAVSSWGRYRGEESFETFKRRLTRLAKRKGLSSALPASWSETKGGGMNNEQLEAIIAATEQMALEAKAKYGQESLPDNEEDVALYLESFGKKPNRRKKKKSDEADMTNEDNAEENLNEDDVDMMDEMGEKVRLPPRTPPGVRPRPPGSVDDGGNRPRPPSVRSGKSEDYLELMDLLEEVGQKARRMKKKSDDTDMPDEEDMANPKVNEESTDEAPYINGFLGTSELQALLERTKPQPKKKAAKAVSKIQPKRETATAEKEPTTPPDELENLGDLRPIPPDPEIEKMMQEVFGKDAVNKNRAKKKLKIQGTKKATKAHDLATVVSMVEEAIHEALEELSVLYEDDEWSNPEMIDEKESIQFIMESLGRKGYEYDEDEEYEVDYDIYVYPEFAVVEFSRASYRVPYAIEQGDVAIGMPSEWTRVTETWKDIPDAPTFAEAVSRDQENAIKAIIDQWSDESLEYRWNDEEVVAEMKSIGEAIKMLEDGTVIAQAVRFGSQSETDISEFRDYFTKSTNFWLTEWQTRPMLYDHATDSQTRDNPIVGQWIKAWTDETGVWLKGQLNKAHKYAEAIKELAKMGLLKLSTDSAPHLVIRTRNENGTHEIKRWPIVAASLTVQPAEPRLPAVEVKTTTTRKKAESRPDTKPTASLDTPLLLQLVEDIQKLGEVE